MRAYLLLLLMLAARPCIGATRMPALDAGGAAMGGISVVGGSWAPLWTPGASRRGAELRASWCEFYGIEGLQATEISFVRLWSGAGLGLSMQALSTPTPYGEVRLGAAGSVAVAEGVALGATLDLRSLRDSGETFARELEASLGLALVGWKGWRFGCSAFTPIASGGNRSSGKGDRRGGFLRWGVGVPVGPCFTLVVEEERDGRSSLRRLGAELRLLRGVALRAGATDSPVTAGFGIGLERGKTSFDLAIVQHEALGATPYLTVSYSGLRPSERSAELAR